MKAMNPTPQDLHRIHDSTRGALRFYEKERERCLRYTNMLYGRVSRPHDEFMDRYAEALREIVGRTHAVKSCSVSSRWVTLQFPHLPLQPGQHYRPGGEISIHLPESREDRHPSPSKRRWVRTFPYVTIRMPDALDVSRRYQLSPRETPEQTWSRCARYFECHLIATPQQAAA